LLELGHVVSTIDFFHQTGSVICTRIFINNVLGEEIHTCQNVHEDITAPGGVQRGWGGANDISPAEEPRDTCAVVIPDPDARTCNCDSPLDGDLAVFWDAVNRAETR
jgi:hypothetical protein